MDLIRQAKAEGLAITAETAPHYLTFTDAFIQSYDPDFKMNPPLRTQGGPGSADIGLQDGTIDCIATDHAPHTPDEKVRLLTSAPTGLLGWKLLCSSD